MESIRILHASDLHIARVANLKSVADTSSSITALFGFLRHPSFANSYDPTILQSFAEFVNNQSSLDAILFTGDIATTGDYPDLERAHRFVEAGITFPWLSGGLMEASLDKIRKTVWIMPGNHDRLERTTLPRKFTPGCREFHNVFDDFWDEDVRAYPLLNGSDFSVAVLAADFSLRSPKDCNPWPLNRYSQGRAYEDILEKLESKTKNLKRGHGGPIAILWAIHFPPEYPNIHSCMKLLKSEALIRAANDCGVRAVLAGHIHKRKRYRTTAMSFEVLCAGTATEHIPEEPNHFQILNITHTQSTFDIRLEHYEFDRRDVEFREVSS